MTNPTEVLQNTINQYMSDDDAQYILDTVGDWPDACDTLINILWSGGSFKDCQQALVEFGA